MNRVTCCLYLQSRIRNYARLSTSSAIHCTPSYTSFFPCSVISYIQQPILRTPVSWFIQSLDINLPSNISILFASFSCSLLSTTAWCHHIPGLKLNISCCENFKSHSWKLDTHEKAKTPPPKNIGYNQFFVLKYNTIFIKLVFDSL
jgi:hypothetical protein